MSQAAVTASDTGGAGAKPILVLQKARSVLDAFTVASPELTLPQIREHCGLPASTTTRLVHNLLNEGLLDRRDEFYRIGPRVLTWAAPAMRALDVVTLLTPVIERLRDTTGESAAIYERRGDQRVCVAVAQTRQAVIWQLHVGLTTPLHVGSGGRALLAFDNDAHDLTGERESFTDHTLADREELGRALAETRDTGVAVSMEELATDVAGVSCPVFGAGGEPVASLGVAGPAQRFQPEHTHVYVPAVLDAGREASRVMGGEFPIPHAATAHAASPHEASDIQGERNDRTNQ